MSNDWQWMSQWSWCTWSVSTVTKTNLPVDESVETLSKLVLADRWQSWLCRQIPLRGSNVFDEPKLTIDQQLIQLARPNSIVLQRLSNISQKVYSMPNQHCENNHCLRFSSNFFGSAFGLIWQFHAKSTHFRTRKTITIFDLVQKKFLTVFNLKWIKTKFVLVMWGFKVGYTHMCVYFKTPNH